MSRRGPRKGQIGFEINPTFVENGTAVDISGATTKKIYLKKPDSGVVVNNTASFKTDGTDGQLTYTTTTRPELDEEGYWKYQGYATDGTTEWVTDISSFPVGENLVDPLS